MRSFLRFHTGCRLIVLHWASILAFLLIAMSNGLGLRFPGMATAAIGLLLLALSLAVVASAFALSKRCARCGERLNDQLPKQPLAELTDWFSTRGRVQLCGSPLKVDISVHVVGIGTSRDHTIKRPAASRTAPAGCAAWAKGKRKVLDLQVLV